MNGYERKNTNKKLLAAVAAILAAGIAVGGIAFGVSKSKVDSPESITTTVKEAVTENVTLPELEITQPEEITKIEEENDVTKKETSQAEDAYEVILNKYRKAADEYNAGKYVDPTAEKLVNIESLLGGTNKYAYVDINGDSVDELVVGSAGSSDEYEPYIMNIWELVDGKAEPLFKDRLFGRRSSVTLCQNGVLSVSAHTGFHSVTEFCKFEDAESEPVLIEAIGTFGQSEDRRFVKFGTDIVHDESKMSEDNYITEKEYEAISYKYQPLTGLQWKTL
ncbi:MAG: hypothetical protein IJ279_01465 [Clostridia bacterium]|nr:hypothetical protein [Clostridia bacterium]